MLPPTDVPAPAPAPAPASAPAPALKSHGFAYEAAKRILAADLLRATFTGRPARLTPSEALRLSDAILARFGIPQQDSGAMADDAQRVAAGSWLGISAHLGFSAGTPCREKEIVAHRFHVSPDGVEVPFPPSDQDGRAQQDGGGGRTREKFDVTWSLGFGGVGGRFAVTSLEIGDEAEDPNDPEVRAREICRSVGEGGQQQQQEEVDWRAKFMALDMTVRLMKGQLNRLQDRVLDAVL